MRSSLDSIVARDDIYDEGVLIKPTRKTDPLITPIFHGTRIWLRLRTPILS